MAPLATYNKTFLDKLFTTKEFDFINSIDSDLTNIDSLINGEENLRDVLVSLINTIQDSNNEEKKSNTLQKNLQKLQDHFEVINKNIQSLQDCKQNMESINASIIDLLIKIESEGKDNAKDKFENEILKLKDFINNHYNSFEKIQSDILLSENKIHKFLTKKDFSKYLKNTSITSIETKNKKTGNSNTKVENSIVSEEQNRNNTTLIISEKDKKVYLPYSHKELSEYLVQYPNQYSSIDDVIEKEFILPIDFYIKHPVVARFREAYSLIRDKESQAVLDALKFAIDLMFRYDLNPAIIAACKTQEQLEKYIACLDKKKLDDFSYFEIKFELAPLKV